MNSKVKANNYKVLREVGLINVPVFSMYEIEHLIRLTF
jgi:hypothetical protein